MKNQNIRFEAQEAARKMHVYEAMTTACTMPTCVCGNTSRPLPELRVPSNDFIGKRVGHKVQPLDLLDNAHCIEAATLVNEEFGLEFYKLSGAVFNLVSKAIEAEMTAEFEVEQARRAAEEEAERLARRSTAVAAVASRYKLPPKSQQRVELGDGSKHQRRPDSKRGAEDAVINNHDVQGGAEKLAATGQPSPYLPRTQRGQQKKSSTDGGGLNGTEVPLAASSN